MIRDTALQIATDTATRVKNLLGGMRWARHPLESWRPDIDSAIQLLAEADGLFPPGVGREIWNDFQRPLHKAKCHLEESVRVKRTNKKHVNHALDILFRILMSSRQAIATT